MNSIRRICIAAMVFALAFTAMETGGQPQVTIAPKSLATVIPSTRLGALQNAQLVSLNSLSAAGGKMFGAGDAKVVEIGENGQVVRTFNTNIKTPTISGFGDTLIIGDCGAKTIQMMDTKTGKLTPLLNLNLLGADAHQNIPNGELVKQLPLTAVAFDGRFVYAAFSGGYSSPIFKIDPKTRRIVGRGFSAGPNPNSMTIEDGKLLVLDQKAQQIRNYAADLKPSRTWTEVAVPDAKGIAVINNEVRVLTPSSGGILRLRVDVRQLVKVSQAIATINPTINPTIVKPVIAAHAAPKKYAVLICGDIAENFWGENFWNDTVWMYKTLRAAGYTKENIYVLYGYGADYNSANPRYKAMEKVTDFPATVSWVNRVFDGLKNGDSAAGIAKMKDNDTLFVWTFDHGGGGTSAYLCLWDSIIRDTDFAAKLNAVPYAKRVIFMQQCRSGGFIDNLQNNKTMISTACSATENANPADTENETYMGKVYVHGEYNYYIISALAKLTVTGTPVNADNNGNGKISAREAHNWNVARNSLTAMETPQISDPNAIGQVFHIVD